MLPASISLAMLQHPCKVKEVAGRAALLASVDKSKPESEASHSVLRAEWIDTRILLASSRGLSQLPLLSPV